jgi:hypothetical protein
MYNTIDCAKISPITGGPVKKESAKIEYIAMSWIYHLDATNPNMVRIVKPNAHPRSSRVFVLEDLKRMKFHIWIMLFESAFRTEFDIGHIIEVRMARSG